MSLEQALADNTEMMKELISMLRATAQAELVVKEPKAKVEKTAAKKEEPAEVKLPGVSYQETQKKLVAVAEMHGRDRAVAILETFGAKKSTELKPEQYPKVVVACDEILNIEKTA